MNRSETHRSSHFKPPILQSETHLNRLDHQSKRRWWSSPSKPSRTRRWWSLWRRSRRWWRASSSPSRSGTFSPWRSRTRSARGEHRGASSPRLSRRRRAAATRTVCPWSGTVGALQHLRRNPQAPWHKTHSLRRHRWLEGLLPQDEGRVSSGHGQWRVRDSIHWGWRE